MKTHDFLYPFLICLCTVWISCEKSADQSLSTSTVPTPQLSTREVPECDDCPNDTDCCCMVELQNSMDDVTISICGSTDGMASCSESGPGACSSISGGGQVIVLNTMNGTRKLWCLGPNNPFSITNLSTTAAAYINISCQYDEVWPQIIPITIDPGKTVYYDSDSGCVLEECD